MATFTPRQKETALLMILAGMGGTTNSTESKYHWLNWFCSDETHTGRKDDTLNRCIVKGWIESSHDSDTDSSTAWLTAEGKLEAAKTAHKPLGQRYIATAVEVATRVHEVARDANGGFWNTCSGCHETEDGHDVGHYAFSEAFNCKLGSGCHECGGIGAVWDTTDYEEMARALSMQSDMHSQLCPTSIPVERVAMALVRSAHTLQLPANDAIVDRTLTRPRLLALLALWHSTPNASISCIALSMNFADPSKTEGRIAAALGRTPFQTADVDFVVEELGGYVSGRETCSFI